MRPDSADSNFGSSAPAEENIHPKRAAAFDVTPETMLRYDTATEKKKTSDEVLGQLADTLLPKAKREGDE